MHNVNAFAICIFCRFGDSVVVAVVAAAAAATAVVVVVAVAVGGGVGGRVTKQKIEQCNKVPSII